MQQHTRYVTARQAADMTGQSERTIRRMIKAGKLKARHVAPNRYEIAVEDLPRKKRDPLGELRAEIAALKERVRTLEAQIARQTRYDDNLTEQAATPIPVATYTPQSPYSAFSARPSDDGFPSSVRKRANWVERMGGPGAAWVRGWADVASWRGPEDAIAAVRKHKNWHDWQPTQ